MNFFLIAAVVFSLNSYLPRGSYSAREIYEKCRTRAVEIDSAQAQLDIGFTQKMTIESRGGDEDSLVFRITVHHGNFERKLLSGTVPNGDRFNAGYDAFDRMFLLSEYFSDRGKVLSSCEFGDPMSNGYYKIDFAFAGPADPGDPLNTVSAVVSPSDYNPVSISERIRGLPLGMEFDNDIDVAHDAATGIYYPGKIVMRIYGKLFFLHGEVGKVTIRNEGLKIL